VNFSDIIFLPKETSRGWLEQVSAVESKWNALGCCSSQQLLICFRDEEIFHFSGNANERGYAEGWGSDYPCTSSEDIKS
jgi:hypothetical protein